MTNEVVAAAVSTTQDESAFVFDKVKEQIKPRTHLGLKDHEDYISRLREYYSINDMASFLSQKSRNENGALEPTYKRITLQFPDSLISDSATIVHELQKKLGTIVETDVLNNPGTETLCKAGCSCSSNKDDCANDTSRADVVNKSSQKIWILADTSYSSCCIDEVAAEHIQSDLVIHFGDACLNPVDKLASVYVFGSPRIDRKDLIQKFKQAYPIDQENPQKILLMADAPYTTILASIYHELKVEYPNLAYSDLYVDPSSKTEIIGYTPHESQTFTVLNRSLIDILVGDSNDVDVDSILPEYSLFHLTTPEAPRLLQLTTRFESVITFDPESMSVSHGPYPNLMRRYRYMHMARSAGTIGILVNTLSLANTKKLIHSIGRKLKEAGKKHYIFVVGKPNVAKLANFENIEMWCILGCDHQGIIIDQLNEYFKPIITPYELMLALSDEISWSGKWITDFKKILDDMTHEHDDDSFETENRGEEEDFSDYEDDAPDFDPVTGKYVSNSKPLRKLQHLQITAQDEKESDENLNQESELVKRFSNAIAIKNTVSTSAVHLQNRQWSGLGSDWQNGSDDDSENGALVEEGRGGIARGYDYDRKINL